MKVIQHSKRYRVDKQWWTGQWVESASYSWRWKARAAARHGQSLGVFNYRVVDTRETDN